MIRAGLSYVCSPECRTKAYAKVRPSEPPGPGKHDTPPEMRATVIERDRSRCRRCARGTGLHVHHIVLRSHGGPSEEWNLITLCFACHELVHRDTRHWQPVLLETVKQPGLSVLQVERRLNGVAATVARHPASSRRGPTPAS